MAENQEQDEENAPEPFRGEEALELARQGKDAWNAWAKENPGREVDFRGVDFITGVNKKISFKDFRFPGGVHFAKAKFPDAGFDQAIFEGDAGFTEATFEGHAWFEKATFEGDAGFNAATFKGYAGFDGATLKGNTKFTGATFTGPVSLENSRFRNVPDFRRSEFKKHLTLHGINIEFRTPTEPDDADKYRRLKELAFNARDHDRAQEFFAFELIAKRGHETRRLKLIPNYLYRGFSGFGRSLWRPSIGLFVVWGAFGVLYSWIAIKNMSHLLDGLLFSAAQLFPFLGASKGALADAKAALFGNAALDAWVNALGMIEGGLGILFLFLIGLALRNRFRI